MWNTFIFFVVIVLIEGTTCSLQWSTSYNLKATLIIPSAEICEPYQVWVNGESNKGRVDFYGGMDKVFREIDTNGDLIYYKIYPTTTELVDNEVVCQQVNVNTLKLFTVNTYLPVKNFKFVGNETLDGVSTQKWEDVVIIDSLYNVTYVYTVWVTFEKSVKGSNVPVPKRYDFTYKVSDNDLEYFRHDYEYYDDSGLAGQVFEIPNEIKCTKLKTFSGAIDPLMEFIDPIHGDERMHYEFERFQKVHNKLYANYKENKMRKAIFKNNLRYIESTNRKHSGFTLAVNHLADLTDDELSIFSGTIHKEHSEFFSEKHSVDDDVDISDVVTSSHNFDWRDYGAITSIKDQTPLCGSCYAFTTAGALESAAYVSQGCKQLVELSEQAIIDCTWSVDEDDGDLGCRGGTYEYALEWILKKGLPTREEYGSYIALEGFCRMKNMTNLITIAGFKELRHFKNGRVKKLLRKYGPMLASINIFPKSFIFYKSGVYNDLKCRSEEHFRNHGVVLIGYGKESGQSYWLIKNSWSEMWGENGYMKLAMQSNICGVKNFLTFVKFDNNNCELCFKKNIEIIRNL